MDGHHLNGDVYPATEDMATEVMPLEDMPPEHMPPEELPEAPAQRAYRAGIASCVRTIAGAVAGKKLVVFRQQAQAAFGLAIRGGLDLEDVGDQLYAAGADLATLDHELGDGWIDTLTRTLGDAKTSAKTAAKAAAKAIAEAAAKITVEMAAETARAPLAAPAAPEGARALIVRRAADVAPEKIEWLWPGRVAVGKLTLIGGTPGLGKSQLTVFAARAVSTGGAWPCGEGHAPAGSVILFSAEDGLADTIVPRLIVAGADLALVHVVTGVQDKDGRRGFNLKADVAALERLAGQIGDVRLIVIDPISAYMGATTDGNDNVKTRSVLEPVAEMADRLRIAVIAVTHLNKSGGGGQTALNRFIGSIAFIAAARAAFAVVADAHDTRRLFLQVKNNLAPGAPGLAFRIEQAMLPDTDLVASRVSFDTEPVAIGVDEALAAAEASGGEERTGTDDAAEFLEIVLADGPVAASEIERQAVDACLLPAGKPIRHSKMFRSAREALGIKPRRVGGMADAGQWVWSLPGAAKVPSNA